MTLLRKKRATRGHTPPIDGESRPPYLRDGRIGTSRAGRGPAHRMGRHLFSLLTAVAVVALSGCATLIGTAGKGAPPVETAVGPPPESPNPYVRDAIVSHTSLPFDEDGKAFPFYRAKFWDTFSLGHYELRVTPEDERPNCLGGLQMNYAKWVVALAREFGYNNALEMVYWGVVFTEVVRGKLSLNWTGSLESSMRRARHRDFYSFFDYMGLNDAEFSWIYFDRVYSKRWVVAMKRNPETGQDAYVYWKEHKKEYPVRVRLPRVDSFAYIPREGDIVVGLYNQTNYPMNYISHIMFCVKGGEDPVFAEQMEEYGLFTPYSKLMAEEFDYGFEGIIRPFYPVDPARFDEFLSTPLTAYNEPIPDGSIFLAPKSKIQHYLMETMKGREAIEAVDTKR
jgi:hypothetical protein